MHAQCNAIHLMLIVKTQPASESNIQNSQNRTVCTTENRLVCVAQYGSLERLSRPEEGAAALMIGIEGQM